MLPKRALKCLATPDSAEQVMRSLQSGDRDTQVMACWWQPLGRIQGLRMASGARGVYPSGLEAGGGCELQTQFKQLHNTLIQRVR